MINAGDALMRLPQCRGPPSAPTLRRGQQPEVSSIIRSTSLGSVSVTSHEVIFQLLGFRAERNGWLCQAEAAALGAKWHCEAGADVDIKDCRMQYYDIVSSCTIINSFFDSFALVEIVKTVLALQLTACQQITCMREKWARGSRVRREAHQHLLPT